MEGKEAFDRTHQIRQEEIKEGDLVLWHDSIAEIDMSWNRKLSYKWLGAYRVKKAIPEKGTYILEEFDGIELSSTYSKNRLKKFVERRGFYVPVATPNSEGSGSSDDEEEGLPSIEVPVERSSRIQQQLDTPM